jgi:hypothetical protein
MTWVLHFFAPSIITTKPRICANLPVSRTTQNIVKLCWKQRITTKLSLWIYFRKPQLFSRANPEIRTARVPSAAAECTYQADRIWRLVWIMNSATTSRRSTQRPRLSPLVRESRDGVSAIARFANYLVIEIDRLMPSRFFRSEQP